MNSESEDESQSPRFARRGILFGIALLVLILCGVAALAEQYWGWQPPDFVRQAMQFVRNGR